MESTKGSRCSYNGNNYERRVQEILWKTVLNGMPFCTSNRLGGSTAGIDLRCNWESIEDLGIEIKTSTSPDWMQCSLKYDVSRRKWLPSQKSKNPENCQGIFAEVLDKNTNVWTQLHNPCRNMTTGGTVNQGFCFGQDFLPFNWLTAGNVPPPLSAPMSYAEWCKIKGSWGDLYLDVSEDLIQRLYREKGCHYLQVSAYGLYHLGTDCCGFGVPEFRTEQRLRIRVKVHARKDCHGNCKLSVMAACQPKNMRLLVPSPYSLDDPRRLPPNLIYAGEAA
ncbi:MAG: hypothetical protein ACYCOU_08490 [Sulfobacillus sp.]